MRAHLEWKAPLLAAVLAVALPACDGTSGFTGSAHAVSGPDDEQPRVVAVGVPEFVHPGDVLEVRIEALGAGGISSVDVTLIESVVRDRTLTVDPPEAEVEAFTEFLLPQQLTRSSVLVQVEVEDQRGARSEQVEVEVPVIQDQGTGG